MARKSKLLAALDAHKGRDFDAEKQKKQRKQAESKARRKQQEIQVAEDEDEDEEDEDDDDGVAVSLEAQAEIAATVDLPESQDSDSDPNEEEVEEEEEDVPLSELESLSGDEKEDIIPHQRLTINNTTALLKSYNSIATPRSAPFTTHQSVTSTTQTEIPDVHDDAAREKAFHAQALEAAVEARRILTKAGVPFTRPVDYFAEMVKSDEHMGKIKARIVSEAAGRKASSEAKRQRELKKYGKKVQVAKVQEREKAKKEMLGRVEVLKRKRKGADLEQPGDDDRFDVALEEPDKKKSRRSDGSRDPERSRDPNRASKRSKKDAKYGFGGKKRFSKSGDAASTGDMRGFSVKKMKAGGAKTGAKKRLGKARRAGRS